MLSSLTKLEVAEETDGSPGLNITNDLLRESRQINAYSPVFTWIGWAVLGVLIIALIIGLVAPLFGRGAYSPFFYRRSLRDRRDTHKEHLKLIRRVYPAIEKTH